MTDIHGSLETFVQSRIDARVPRFTILKVHGELIVDAPELYADVSNAVLAWLIENVPPGRLEGMNAMREVRHEKLLDAKWVGTAEHSACRFELRYIQAVLESKLVVTVFKNSVPYSLNAFAAEYLL